jgi:DNA polymerase-3 subunit delta
VAAKPKAKPQANGNFHAIVGTDEGLVREKALLLHNQLTGGVDDGFTHETIDGIADNSESAHEICSTTVQALLTIPMFGGDKVVWLRNANFLADTVTGRSQRTEAGIDSLKAALEKGIPDGVKFLLTAQGVDKRRSFWKFVEKTAAVQVFDRIDTSRDDWMDQVGALVEKRAGELGLDFEQEALELFILLAGEQSQQIGNELEKLDLYLGPERRTVTEADVRVMVPLSRAAVVFEIGKAIQKGDAVRAIHLIDQQLEADESAIGIMRASVIPTIRNLFMAKLIVEKLKVPTGGYPAFSGALNRLSESERAWLPQKKDGTGVNVFPIFLAVQSSANFEFDGLMKVMEATLKADQALVTTGLDHRLVLHRLMAEIAAARKAPRRQTAAR